MESKAPEDSRTNSVSEFDEENGSMCYTPTTTTHESNIQRELEVLRLQRTMTYVQGEPSRPYVPGEEFRRYPGTPTTSESVVEVYTKTEDLPRNTFIPSHCCRILIRSATTDHLLTLLDGSVTLAPPDTNGATIWHVVESQGWMGFRNGVTGKFLCHYQANPMLHCSAEQQDSLRHFTITPVSGGNGGHILQMADWWTLRPVVVSEEGGVKRLGRTGDRLTDGEVWEFVDVGEEKK
jgi:hypothetical protein